MLELEPRLSAARREEARRLRPRLELRRGAVVRNDARRLPVRVVCRARGLPAEVIDEVRMQPGEGIAGHVVATGRALLVQDVERDDRFTRPNRERYFTHSLVSAPLVLQGQVRGVINVNNKRNKAPYTNADLRLLQAIAGHAAVALSNARRYEEMEARAQRDAHAERKAEVGRTVDAVRKNLKEHLSLAGGSADAAAGVFDGAGALDNMDVDKPRRGRGKRSRVPMFDRRGPN